MSKTKISVIIPVYNPDSFLLDSVHTLLRESVDLEVLVVDDGSAHPLPVWREKAVRLIRHERNKGPAAAMNSGIRAATGAYLAFLDQDDVLVPNSLNWRRRWLEDHPLEQAVMGAVAGIIDERKQSQNSYRMVLKRRLFEVPDRLTYKHFVAGGWVPLSPLALCLFRAPLIQDVGLLDESLLRAHDREYFYRLLKRTEIPYVDRSVLFYRLHDNNLSVSVQNGKIVPHKRTVAELFLINEEYGIPFPAIRTKQTP
ncbi:MAG: glycosyltransferase family 2 protein [Bdellovibrionales bacterium]|nr:glycosyltransferase family 2 protein [Bdellovibrionales bacterium]